MDANQIIADIIRREGDTYTDNPDDRGGPTKFGIDQATLASYVGHPVSAQDVSALTEARATEIYASQYVLPFAHITNPTLQAFLVDSGVQHGVATVIRWVQQACAVQEDGLLGPLTLQAVTHTGVPVVYRRVVAIRCRYYGMIIDHDHSQAEFALGWANRLAQFIEISP